MATNGFDNARNDSIDEGTLLQEVELFRAGLQTHSEVTTIVLMALYIPVFFVAFGGNSLVLVVVLMNRHMRSVTNILLLNLAVADLAVSLVCVPMAVGQSVYKAWIYGDFMCKFMGFLQGTAVTASVFTIAILSLDRFFAIRRPMLFKRICSTKMVARVILAVWILSTCIMVPMIVTKQVKQVDILFGFSVSYCMESWPGNTHRLVYDTCLFLIVYVIPGSVIVTSYVMIGKRLWREDAELQRGDSEISKSNGRTLLSTRKRVAKMLVALAILFAVCWLPYYVLTMYINIQAQHTAGNKQRVSNENVLIILTYAILLGHSNSAINPILYFYASKSFRRCLKKFFHCIRFHRRPASSPVRVLP